MKKLFLILAFLITPVFAQSVSEIAKQIPDFDSISCKFRQEKEFSGMVVKSSGDFVYEKNKGVTFYTTYPIKSTASYTTKEYRHINNVINAISNKNYSKLEKDFGFDFVKNSDIWTLKLAPKQSSQAYGYLKTLEISGGKTKINKMIILMCDGTKTSIWFQ